MKNSPQTHTDLFPNMWELFPLVLWFYWSSGKLWLKTEVGGGTLTKRSRRKECVSRNAAWSVGQQRTPFSYDFLDAWPLEAAGAALLLHVAGRAVSRTSTGGNRRARRQLHVLLINTCRVTAHTERAAKRWKLAWGGERERDSCKRTRAGKM